MDAIDSEILRLLRADGRISWRDLGAAVGLSSTAAADRVRQLFGSGLTDRGANLELVVLAPKVWGPPNYDSLRQELVRPIAPPDGSEAERWFELASELDGDPAQWTHALDAYQRVTTHWSEVVVSNHEPWKRKSGRDDPVEPVRVPHGS